MKTIYGFVIILLMPFLLTSCMYEVKPQDIASADYGKVPPIYKQAIEGYMQGRLFDPYSAMYRYLGEPMRGYAHVHGGANPPEFGHVVEVGINAKNRMGAYTGEKMYVFLFKNDNFWLIENPMDPYIRIIGPALNEDLPGGQSGSVAATTPKTGVTLGVNLLPVKSPAKARIFKLEKPRGLYIVIVQPDGVAARTGILAGDVILKYDDKAVNTLSDLQGALAATAQGSTVSITIWRQGKEFVLPVSF